MKNTTRFFFSIILGLLLTATPGVAGRYALLVGCNNGGTSVDPLRYAEKDAQVFAGLLTKLGGFEQNAVVTLLHPDSAALEGRLQSVRKQLSLSESHDADLFLFYYSGHADGTDMLLGNTRYPFLKLRKFLDSLPAGVRIGVFDACQSGAVTAYKGGKRAEPFYLKNPQRIKGQVIISSTSASERAQESETLHGSIFTFYWISGLRGSADASGDRKVTLSEAYAYAYRKTLETSTLTGGEAQHPMYRFNIFGEGDIILTDLANRTGGIAFDKSTEGKFLVLSDSYTDIFADFYKKKNSENYVSLDPGSYRVINANNGSVGLYSFTLGPNSLVDLRQSMLEPNPLEESRIKGTNEVAKVKMEEPAASPLSVWSHGFGLAGYGVMADGEKTRQSLELSFANSRYLSESMNLFLNVRYFTPNLNFGFDAGFDFLKKFETQDLLAGLGVGLFYRENGGTAFEDRLAPAATVHAGFTIPVGKSCDLVVQVPYSAIIGNSISHRVGLEVKVLWSGKYKDVKVLEY